MDDAKLIEAIKSRNQDAMVALHQRYVDLIYSLCFRVLNDPQGAEECTQDVFMRVWQNIAQYDGARGSLAGWLVGIARNLAIDRLRQRGRQVTVDDRDALEDRDALIAAHLPNDWRDREKLEGLRLALKDLPTEQYQVVHLAYYGGMSHQDIADELRLPLGTVKTRIRLGLQKLREAWHADD